MKFLEMENTVYFRAKTLMETWYLLITEKFLLFFFLIQKVDGKMIFTDYWKILLWTFSKWKIRSFFFSQKADEKMIFTDYWNVFVLNFSVMPNTVFFSTKKLMERWFLLFFLFLFLFLAFHVIPRLGKHSFSYNDEKV